MAKQSRPVTSSDTATARSRRRRHVTPPLRNSQLALGIAKLLLAAEGAAFQSVRDARAKAMSEGNRLAKLEVENVLDRAKAVVRVS